MDGIAGGPSCDIQNCCSFGEIHVKNYYGGGIEGSTEIAGKTALYCYSLTKMSGASAKGALDGKCYYANWNMKFKDSVYCKEISGIEEDRSGYGTKVQYEDLFKKSTYENWDFDNVWQIEEGKTTPYLRWMGNPPQEVKRENIDKTLNN